MPDDNDQPGSVRWSKNHLDPFAGPWPGRVDPGGYILRHDSTQPPTRPGDGSWAYLDGEDRPFLVVYGEAGRLHTIGYAYRDETNVPTHTARVVTVPFLSTVTVAVPEPASRPEPATLQGPHPRPDLSARLDAYTEILRLIAAGLADGDRAATVLRRHGDI
jgi:hypothetical protein